MTTPPRPIPPMLKLSVAGLAVLALAVACEVPTYPAADEAAPVSEARAGSEEEATPSARESPRFTPMTQRPRIRNRDEVERALRQAYPAELRRAGIGGRGTVWFFIDATGEVQDVRVAEGSGHEELDRAALEVARTYSFEPARNRAQPVPAWVQFPLIFRTR